MPIMQIKFGTFKYRKDFEGNESEFENHIVADGLPLSPEVQAAIDLKYGTQAERAALSALAQQGLDLLNDIDVQFQQATYDALPTTAAKAEANRRAILAHNRILKRIAKLIGSN